MNNINYYFNWPIIGNQNVINYLQNCLYNKQLAHAYLFWGPVHLGKKTVANYFSQTLFCENFQKFVTAVPCQQCQNCQQFQKNLYPDYFEINLLVDKQDIIIEQIKNLQSQLKLKSFLKNYKIAIINQADKLNQVSANALLKTLEEPAANTIIILIAENLSQIIPTIISRCQIIKFNLVKDDLIYDYLLTKEKKREEIKLIIKLIQGKIGLIFQNNFDKILEDYHQQINQLIKIINAPAYQKIRYLNSLIKNKTREQVEELIKIWLTYFRDLFFLKTANTEKIINQQHLNDLVKINQTISFLKLINLLKILNNIFIKLQLNINPKILLENLILNI